MEPSESESQSQTQVTWVQSPNPPALPGAEEPEQGTPPGAAAPHTAARGREQDTPKSGRMDSALPTKMRFWGTPQAISEADKNI